MNFCSREGAGGRKALLFLPPNFFFLKTSQQHHLDGSPENINVMKLVQSRGRHARISAIKYALALKPIQRLEVEINEHDNRNHIINDSSPLSSPLQEIN